MRILNYSSNKSANKQKTFGKICEKIIAHYNKLLYVMIQIIIKTVLMYLTLFCLAAFDTMSV